MNLNLEKLLMEVPITKIEKISATYMRKKIFLGTKNQSKIKDYKNLICMILKSKNPSCGYKKIYDGSFNGNLISENGITAELFILTFRLNGFGK